MISGTASRDWPAHQGAQAVSLLADTDIISCFLQPRHRQGHRARAGQEVLLPSLKILGCLKIVCMPQACENRTSEHLFCSLIWTGHTVRILAAHRLCHRQTCMSSGLPNAGSAASVASGQGIELDHLQVALQACPGAQCIMKDACKTILGIEAALVSVGSRNSERRFWCLSRGANVVVNYAGSKDAAEAVAKEIEGMGVKAMAVKVFYSFLFQSLLLIPRVQRWHGSMLTASFWIFPSCFSLDLSSRPSHTFQICASMHN